MIELCIHAANLLYLASFLGRDMLWLRIFTCGGMVLGLIFFACRPAPLYGPAIWHAVFLAINAYHITVLIRERRALALSEEQERVGLAALQHLSRDELLTLLTRAVHTRPEALRDLAEATREPLTPEEKALRDIAFRRLSYKELVNLVVRRLWVVITMTNPARWGRGRGRTEVPPAPEPVPAPN